MKVLMTCIFLIINISIFANDAKTLEAKKTQLENNEPTSEKLYMVQIGFVNKQLIGADGYSPYNGYTLNVSREFDVAEKYLHTIGLNFTSLSATNTFSALDMESEDRTREMRSKELEVEYFHYRKFTFNERVNLQPFLGYGAGIETIEKMFLFSVIVGLRAEIDSYLVPYIRSEYTYSGVTGNGIQTSGGIGFKF